MDHFEAKASDWDTRPVPQQISSGVGPRVVAHLPDDANQRILDFGAGTGLLSSHVAPHVARVAAVDISPSMLAKLADKPELAGKVTTHCQDIMVEPLGETFDGIVSAMAMHHVEDTRALLRAFHAHLEPGGFVALADLDAEDGSFHPPETEGVYHQGFDRAALGAELEAAGFEDVRFETAIEVTKEDRAYPIFLVTAHRG